MKDLPSSIVTANGLEEFKSALSRGDGAKKKDDNTGKGNGYWKDQWKNKESNKHPYKTNDAHFGMSG